MNAFLLKQSFNMNKQSGSTEPTPFFIGPALPTAVCNVDSTVTRTAVIA
ncbi:hypothetical protein RESH_05642 [Rhodopirellula europaea SH398]|uniref:Uncharacterized protein n=1 Tax=Rhodopirellula europaea SH398 TaxID=1263868 RepID=M5RX98_9BACT|nr:hypothetical protein RESH_05642 [Rhodopirellula europaea SH398]